jgi:hypothetical protein
MSHQPFEDLLFSDGALNQRQESALHDHIQSCDSCYQLSLAWRETESQLQAAPVIAPRAGFVARWNARLELDQKRRQGRQNLIMLVSTWGAAAVLLVGLVYLAWPLIQSPKIVILTYLYQLIGLLSLANFVQGLLSALTQGYSGGLQYLWLVLVAGVITLMGVLWVVSIRYLTNPRRVTL